MYLDFYFGILVNYMYLGQYRYQADGGHGIWLCFLLFTGLTYHMASLTPRH